MASRIHIGCGERRLPGYVGIDVRLTDGVDVISDAMGSPLPLRSESAAMIYACMVIEHYPFDVALAALAGEWKRVLAKGGVVRLSLPDFSSAAEWYSRIGGVASFDGLLLGGHKYPGDDHHTLWDWSRAEGLLYRAGYQSILGWDWRRELPGDYDDFASAFLPDWCKATGRHMAINIQGVKP